MFTNLEQQFLNTAFNDGLEKAKAELFSKKETEMAETFKGTPATEKEIASHTKVAAKTFYTTVAKKLRSLATDIVK